MRTVEDLSQIAKLSFFIENFISITEFLSIRSRTDFHPQTITQLLQMSQEFLAAILPFEGIKVEFEIAALDELDSADGSLF